MKRQLVFCAVVSCVAVLMACGPSATPPPMSTAAPAMEKVEPTAAAEVSPMAKLEPVAAPTPSPAAVPGEPAIILENEYSMWISEEEPAAEMAIEEIMESWVGERAIFLPPAIAGLALKQYASNAGNNGCSSGWNDAPYDPYAGRTGVIVAAQAANEPELRIALDGTGEEVVLCAANGLGFFTELEFAESLVGQELWTRKEMTLARTCPSPVEVAAAFTATSYTMDKYEAAVPPISKVVVTRVEWGIAVPGEPWSIRRAPALGERPIVLYFKTEGGAEYCTYSSKQHFLDRFHPLVENTDYSGLRRYTSDFYLQDPVKRHPDWSPDAWDLIRKGEIAIGMDLEMALTASGGQAWIKGYVLPEASGSAGVILQASAPPYAKFVVQDGKVTELLDQ